MNDQVYNLVIEILKSDLTRESKDEIVRFFLLPRNTPVRPKVEQTAEELVEEFGTVHRPTPHNLDRKANPKMAQEEDAIADSLGGRI